MVFEDKKTNYHKKQAMKHIPKHCPYCDHKLVWSSVDVYCENKKCEGKNYTRLINFFSTIGIDEIGSGTIDQLWSAGYTSVRQLLRANSKKLKKIEGFASKKADTVAKGLKSSVNGISLAKLMHASGYFSTETSGLGEIRLQNIIDELGTKQILNYDNVIRKKKKMVRKIADIEGLSEKSADIFVSNLPDFIKFYRTIEDKVVLKDNKKSKGKLKNMKFCFTGFRDKHLQSQIEDNGGKLTNSVNKDLDILFAKDQNTTKAKQARAKGVEIVGMQNARSKVQELLS